MNAAELKKWTKRRALRDRALYERYGKALEHEHTGRFVLISDGGEVLLGEDELALTLQGIERFGRGNFALRRIGFDYNVRLR